MKPNRENEPALRKYLLGDLAEERQERLEQRLMTDSECFRDLQVTEDELIDEYVRGSLSGHEKTRFDDHFLCSSERRQKLSFATALRDYIETAGVQKRQEAPVWQRLLAPLRGPSPALGFSMTAAVLLLVLGVVWLIGGYWRLHSQLNEVLTEQGLLRGSEQDLQRQLAEERDRTGGLTDELRREQGQRASLERDLASLRAQQQRSAFGVRPSGPPPVASFLLAPGLFRGMGDMERVIIPAGSPLVQLQLDLGVDDYQSYRAVLQEAEGDQLWTQSKLKAETVGDKIVVTLTLPSALLPHGDYHLRLSGLTASGDIELVARYYFRAIVE